MGLARQRQLQRQRLTLATSGDATLLALATLGDASIEIESLQNRLIKVCYVPATSTRLPKLLSILLLRPITELIKQTRRAIKQSILLRCLWMKQKLK